LAEVIEQCFPEICANQPELLAHHFTEAQVPAKAVENWARAGERGQQRGAVLEAINHYRLGLDLLQSLPETRERDDQEIRMNVGLGMALERTKGSGAPQVDSHFERAQRLCQQTGNPSQLFTALYGRYRCWQLQGQHGRSLELAKELLALAGREQNPGFLAASHRSLGRVLFYQGKHAEALAHLEKVVAVPATPELRTGIYRYDVADPWVFAHSYLSLIHWLLGYPERAAEQSRRALHLADSLNHTFTVAVALRYACWLHQFCHDRERTFALADRERALAKEHGNPVFACWAKILRGWAMMDGSQSEQAMAEICQGLAEGPALGAKMALTYHLTLQAEACMLASRFDEGLQALSKARAWADTTEEHFWLAEIYRLQGELFWRHDPTNIQNAEASFYQALKLAQRQQARSLELRAAMSVAQLRHSQGQTQAARELLAPVYASFTEGFQTHDLKNAQALLKQWQ
jgi:predicted ATPase